ncbi:MAG TPA: hypothetical protein VFW21_15465 [Mycobacterium sp.]|nr:hypothetical protein [Mycobacterium sp.]
MPSLARIPVPFVAAALLLGGCGAKPVNIAPPTIEPAQAAVAPSPTAAPAGSVRALTGTPLAAVVDGRALVVLTDRALQLLEPAPALPRSIPLPAAGTALTGDGAGRVVLATRGGYLRVELGTGTVQRVSVDDKADFTAIARRADGRLVLGSADGSVFLLDSAGTGVAHRDRLFARVDSIVMQGNTAVVLDRGQTSVTAVDADGNATQALRAGEGATVMAADAAGRVLVTDTRGGELLVFGTHPLMLRQRYPVPDAPYGVTGSPRLTWVSQTATNSVIGYDLATGIPVEKVRYPTVKQPNLLAYDDGADALFVLSAAGAGVQVIDHPGGSR